MDAKTADSTAVLMDELKVVGMDEMRVETRVDLMVDVKAADLVVRMGCEMVHQMAVSRVGSKAEKSADWKVGQMVANWAEWMAALMDDLKAADLVARMG